MKYDLKWFDIIADTLPQVCNMIWPKRTDDIRSSYGYTVHLASQSNQNLYLDKKIGNLSSHTSCVLYMSNESWLKCFR